MSVLEQQQAQRPTFLGNTPHYPINEKETFGPHYWFTLHNSAANYPEYPTDRDKDDFRGLFNTVVRNVPCNDSCRIHARDYVRMHSLEPALENRDKLFDYLCHFHNYVNKLTGKPIYACESMLSNRIARPKAEVEKDQGLFAEPRPEQQPDNIRELPQGQSNDEYNQSQQIQPQTQQQKPKPRLRRGSTTTIKQKGDGDRLESPEERIGRSDEDKEDANPRQTEDRHDGFGMESSKFNNNGQRSSGSAAAASDTEAQLESLFENYRQTAIDVVKAIARKEGVPEPQIKFSSCPDQAHPNTSCNFINNDNSVTIYLNPYNYSLRSTIHEMQHYVARHKGVAEMSESEAEAYARDMIGKKFHHDNMPDSIVMSGNNRAVFDEQGHIDVKDPETRLSVRSYADELGGSDDVFTRFPRLREHIEKTEAKRAEEQQKREATEGILSHLDHVYDVPATWFGVTGAQLNTIATPILLQNIINTVVEANTTPLGAVAINLITGLALLGGLAVSKANISHRDKLLMTGLAATFTFSSIRYANPKLMEDLKKNIIQANEKINSGDWNLFSLFFETPGMSRFNKQQEAINLIPHVAMARARQSMAGQWGQPPSIGGVRSSANNMGQGSVDRNTIQNIASTGGASPVAPPFTGGNLGGMNYVDNSEGAGGGIEQFGAERVIAARRNPAERLQIAGGDEGASIFM